MKDKRPRRPGMLDAILRSKSRIAIMTALCIGVLYWVINGNGGLAQPKGEREPLSLLRATAANVLSSSSSSAVAGKTFCHKEVKPFPLEISRETYGTLLQSEADMEIGVELGVQEGRYAESILRQWTNCKKYILVDLWKHQELNYQDIANHPDERMNELYHLTKERLKPFEERTKLEYMKMYTSEAAKLIPDGSLDFIYVDARHDYCGCKEDMELFWPKLREGGLMAGHDYVVPSQWEASGQDWTVCEDGSRHPTAVIGAVNDFAVKNDLQVVVTPYDDWKSWMIRRPKTVCRILGGATSEV